MLEQPLSDVKVSDLTHHIADLMAEGVFEKKGGSIGCKAVERI